MAMNVTDPDDPTESMYQAAQEFLTDEFLAVLFITNSDQNRYGDLLRDLENRYARNNNFDEFPKSLIEAYSMLIAYRPPIRSRGGHDQNIGGISYYVEHGDQASPNSGDGSQRNVRQQQQNNGGRGGRGGRGGGGSGGQLLADVQSLTGNISANGSGYAPGTYQNVAWTGSTQGTGGTATFTVPGLAIRPTSFLPKSINMRCSAISLGSLTISFSIAISSASSLPLLLVPAIGLTVTLLSSSLAKISGEDPTI